MGTDLNHYNLDLKENVFANKTYELFIGFHQTRNIKKRS